MHVQNANLSASHIGKINLWKIHAGRCAALGPESSQFFGHIHRDRLLRLLGAAANVRCKNHIGQARERCGETRAIFCGFLWKNINRRAANMATFQGRSQRNKVNHFAATVVHQHGARLHLFQLRRAN